ncbi:hypothetical protein, partial [Gordonia aurantiaca]|uniref:hypothetical protein n=1 Tax=Gordonia sp. B21 TaxID=3151852 RepID=UPI0032643610
MSDAIFGVEHSCECLDVFLVCGARPCLGVMDWFLDWSGFLSWSSSVETLALCCGLVVLLGFHGEFDPGSGRTL